MIVDNTYMIYILLHNEAMLLKHNNYAFYTMYVCQYYDTALISTYCSFTYIKLY